MADLQVAVVGAGLAGLIVADELATAGVQDLVVLEKHADPGGVARTRRFGSGYVLEPAVGSFSLPHPVLGPILERSGVEVAPARDTTRHVYTRGALHAITPGPRTLLLPLLGVGAKLRAGVEPLLPATPIGVSTTLGDFMRARFGAAAGDLIGTLMASGVFAGDPDRLSLASAYPGVHALGSQGSLVRAALRARRSGAPRPVIHVPVEGMDRLTAALATRLGGRVRTGFSCETIRPHAGGWRIEGAEALTAREVVLAVPPLAAAPLLDTEAARSARGAVTAPVAVAAVGGTFPLPSGFGALTGPDTGLATLGVLFESSYHPGRAPADRSMVKIIAGGRRRPGLVDTDDGTVLEQLIGELEVMLGAHIEPEQTLLVRSAIPQYETGHAAWLAELEAALPPRLHLTGWGYRGVGLAQIAVDAVRTARRLRGTT